LLPQLARDWNPAIGETLANTADWALAEEAYWEAEIDRLAAGEVPARAADLVCGPDALLTALPLAAGRRLVRRAMERVKGDLRGIDFGHIEAVLDLAAGRGHGRCKLPAWTSSARSIGCAFAPTRTRHPGEPQLTASRPPCPGVCGFPARIPRFAWN
jgi:hypothetical protein